MIDISPIFQLQAENMSGCLRLRLAKVKDIAVFPRMVGGVLNDNIEFNAGKGWTEWRPIENTFGFEAQTSENMEGVIQSNRIRFTLPATEIDEYMLNQLQLDNLIVLVTDSNLNNWIFGSPERPMKFRYDRNTGVRGSGRNEYGCFFLGRPFSPRALYREITQEIFGYIQQTDGFYILDMSGNKFINNAN
jgi:hypothetical protein